MYVDSFKLFWADLGSLSSYKLISAHASVAKFYSDWLAYERCWSFEHRFNLTSRMLSETIGKWVLLMWKVGTLQRAVITENITKLKTRIPMWLTVA